MYLPKNIYLTVLAIFSLIISNAQINQTFGTFWNGTHEMFVSTDLSTGIVTEIDTINGVSGILNLTSSFDPNNGTYIVQTDIGIILIDVLTGAILNTFSTPNDLKGLEYDPITTLMYGSYWSGTDEIFISMDLNTGIITDIDTLNGVQYIVNMTSTFDIDNGYYITQTNFGVTVIDKMNGSIVYVFPTTNDLKGLEYDPASSKIYGSYWTGNEEIFTSIDMFSGTSTDIDTLNGVTGILNLTSTFDYENSLYFTQTNLGITIIDVLTGSILNTFTTPNDQKVLEFPYCYFPDVTKQITVTKSSICQNNFSQLSAYNGSYDYLWTNGETTKSIVVDDSLSYSVHITNNFGCKTNSNDVSIKIFDCSNFIDSLSYTIDTCLFDSTSIIMAYANNKSIINDTTFLQWNFITNIGDTLTQNAKYYFPESGVYTIGIGGNCSGKTDNLDFFYDMIELKDISINIENKEKFNSDIYPNPTQDFLYFSDLNSNINEIKIYSTNGYLVKKINSNFNEIDLSNFESGIYFIQLSSKDFSLTKKIIKY